MGVMNPHSFDGLSRRLAVSTPRRSIVGRLAAVVVGVGAAVPVIGGSAQLPEQCSAKEILRRAPALRTSSDLSAATARLSIEKKSKNKNKNKNTISRAACACLNDANFVFGQVALLCAVVADDNASVEEACLDDAFPCLDAIAACRNGNSCLDAWADEWLAE
jgi:hypothetical protein